MAKSLVVYFSQTGNTKKVAEALYETLEDDKRIHSVRDPDLPAPSAFDVIFIGFPVHSHSVPYAMETFLKTLPPGTLTAFFSTHGSLTGSRLSREALEYATVAASGAHVIGTFSCRGRVSPEALESLKKSPEHEAWLEMAASAHTHPDKNDLEEARAFARWIMTLAASGS